MKLSRILFYFVPLFLGIACLMGCRDTQGYRIEGKAEGNRGIAVLRYQTPAGETVRDTVELQEGVYVFNGKVDDVVLGEMLVFSDGVQPSRLFFYVENCPLTVADGIVTGGPNNAFVNGLAKAGDALDKNAPDYADQLKKALIDYALAHRDVEVAAYMYNLFARQLPYEEFAAGFKRFSKKVQNCYLAKQAREDLVSRKAMQPGATAPDFTLKALDGKKVSLSSLRGQYVLIDFWASWCKPCLAGMPELKDLYGKYHGKGFEILGVSIDTDEEAWKKAVADGDLPWTHVLDEITEKGIPSRAAGLYGIRSIPTYILIDKDGKIVGKVKRADLPAKLAELLD